MFPPFVIVMYESLNFPCGKVDLKILQSLLERVQGCRRCWKTKEDFSEEQQEVELLRTNNRLINDYHKI